MGGSLDVLKETWEASGNNSDESVVSYILSVQEKMERMTELVKENSVKAKAQQKTWYDRNARSREFQPGDQVLVLLPTSTSKLLAQWQGPYPVIRSVGSVNYQIDMVGKRKRKRIFHVNMLQKWNTPTSTVFWAKEEESPEAVHEEEDVVLWKDGDSNEEKSSYGEQLTEQQLKQLQGVLTDFKDVLYSEPGQTDLVEHTIETGSAPPSRQPPYHIPHACRDTIKEELKEIEQAGVIQPSTSEWAALIVLVKKKDGTLRFCVDYRCLNKLSQGDAYPMPRIDELIDRLGKAKYISTLDLARGYWQVPMAEKDRHKTAFATPYGLYQFTVMLFRLQGAPATIQRIMD